MSNLKWVWKNFGFIVAVIFIWDTCIGNPFRTLFGKKLEAVKKETPPEEKKVLVYSYDETVN